MWRKIEKMLSLVVPLIKDRFQLVVIKVREEQIQNREPDTMPTYYARTLPCHFCNKEQPNHRHDEDDDGTDCGFRMTCSQVASRQLLVMENHKRLLLIAAYLSAAGVPEDEIPEVPKYTPLNPDNFCERCASYARSMNMDHDTFMINNAPHAIRLTNMIARQIADGKAKAFEEGRAAGLKEAAEKTEKAEKKEEDTTKLEIDTSGGTPEVVTSDE